ncbi:MAG: hypothetical protein K5756_02180, partial [Clostridiales bacterium]|nr:hypothetical protein [Clostridiales bacterium]
MHGMWYNHFSPFRAERKPEGAHAMLFSSLHFLLLFLPVFFVCYYAEKKRKTKNAVLFAFSLLFYAWGEPLYVLLM